MCLFSRMPENNSPSTPQETLERIEMLLEKIEDHLAPPPLWQRVLKFVFEHLIMIISVVSLLYFTWKIWGYVSNIVTQVDGIKLTIDSIKSFLSSNIDDLKFW